MSDSYEHIFIESNTVKLHVVVAGDPRGRPVILLHGFPEFWYGWRCQIPALASAGFRVIIPDQRGYNLSDKPIGVNAFRVAELSQDILNLLDHLGLEKADIIGHDWGAAIAWNLAINFPRRVEHLVIMNVPHPGVLWNFLHHSPRQVLKSWYVGFFQIPALPEWLLGLNDHALAQRLLTSSGRPGTFTPADLSEYKQAWAQPGALTAMINWYRAAFRNRSPMAATQRVIVPTLVLWGKRDVALRSEMAQRSIELCDNGQLIYFEDASHWVQLDEAEAVNQYLLEFLKEK
jgi:pimeloyl-ACP methyl ester carboxylesterase